MWRCLESRRILGPNGRVSLCRLWLSNIPESRCSESRSWQGPRSNRRRYSPKCTGQMLGHPKRGWHKERLRTTKGSTLKCEPGWWQRWNGCWRMGMSSQPYMHYRTFARAGIGGECFGLCCKKTIKKCAIPCGNRAKDGLMNCEYATFYSDRDSKNFKIPCPMLSSPISFCILVIEWFSGTCLAPFWKISVSSFSISSPVLGNQ